MRISHLIHSNFLIETLQLQIVRTRLSLKANEFFLGSVSRGYELHPLEIIVDIFFVEYFNIFESYTEQNILEYLVGWIPPNSKLLRLR